MTAPEQESAKRPEAILAALRQEIRNLAHYDGNEDGHCEPCRAAAPEGDAP